MSIVNAILSVAAYLLTAAPTATPAPAASTSTPLIRQPIARKAPLMQELFVRSPLAAETHPVTADLIDTIFRSEAVQKAAGICAAARQRLTEVAGFKAEISAAIQAAVESDDDLDIHNVSPAMVAEALRKQADVLEEAAMACKDDHSAHHAASRARLARHEPLRAVVSRHLTTLSAERHYLIDADESERRAASIGLPTRYRELRNAGLTEGQIALSEPDTLNPDVAAQRRRERLAEIAPQIEALHAFGRAPLFDAAIVANIHSEIDAAIVERDGALPEVEVAQ